MLHKPTDLMLVPGIFTTHKRSLRFYTCLSVILFTEGGLPQCMLGYTPYLGRHLPPYCRHPRSRHPPRKQTPLKEQKPRSTQCMLGDTGNKRRYASYWKAYLLYRMIMSFQTIFTRFS